MYKALISFCGLVTMAEGEIREIPDQAIAKDLIKAGYVEEIKTEKKASPKKAKK